MPLLRMAVARDAAQPVGLREAARMLQPLADDAAQPERLRAGLKLQQEHLPVLGLE